jgi:hypothetical protein
VEHSVEQLVQQATQTLMTSMQHVGNFPTSTWSWQTSFVEIVVVVVVVVALVVTVGIVVVAVGIVVVAIGLAYPFGIVDQYPNLVVHVIPHVSFLFQVSLAFIAYALLLRSLYVRTDFAPSWSKNTYWSRRRCHYWLIVSKKVEKQGFEEKMVYCCRILQLKPFSS